ncbi:MAG TPA: cytochrome c oxidase subunit 3 [Polyangiaceae bacterium]|nr:cytochrome c oxidase subunit 3 [Polyangiaceae bacterium]
MPSPSTPPSQQTPSSQTSTAQLGMVILLLSLSMLFGAGLVAVVVTRAAAKVWNSDSLSLLSLIPGSAILLLLSAVMERARSQLRRNSALGLQRMLWAAFVLALAFLGAQALAFYRQFAGMAPAADALPLFCFVLLVSLHALHVLGGLIALGIVLRRAARGDYSSSRPGGVNLMAQYFHYLAVVWLVLLGVLYAVA